jgi:(p)ppGpp synthase/HD superfamily hydrolase
MDFLHTSDAKTHLLRFIKNLQKSDLLKHAFNELDKTLKEYSLPIYGSANDEISKKINKLDMEKRMLEVSDKKTNYNMIIKEIYPKQRDKIIQNTQKTYTKKESPTNISKDNTVIIDEDKITSCSLCHECNPTY